MAINSTNRTLTANNIEGVFSVRNYLPSQFENGTVNGYTLGTVGTLTNGIPTGTPTFGSGASGNLSLTTTSTNPISESFSLSLASSAATTQGDMLASPALTIDSGDQAKVLTYKFYYSIPTNPSNGNFSGTSSNSFAVAAYDVTNSSWLSLAGNFSMTQNSGVGIATGTCQTNSNTTTIRFVIYNANATAGAITAYFDNFYFGPQTTNIGPVLTDFSTNLTFTASAGFGTITGSTIESRRDGDSLTVKGRFLCGTVAASAAYIQLPSGLSIDSNKISSSQQIVGTAYRVNAGSFASTGSGPWPMFYDGSTTNQIFICGSSTGTSLNKTNGSTLYSSSDPAIFEFSVPIAGWSSNLQVSSDANTRVVTAIVSGAAANTSANGIIIFPTTQKDTNAAYNSTTGQYTAPITGYYNVSAGINGSIAASSILSPYVAGVKQTPDIGYPSSGNVSGSVVVYALAGQTIDIRANSAYTSIAASSGMSIVFINGPSVISASESVNAKGLFTVSQSAVLNTQLTIASKAYDSHNAMTLAGAYTIPVSGVYHISLNELYTVSPGNSWAVWKNGSIDTLVFESAANQGNSGATDIKCLAGDILTIRPGASGTTGSNATSAWSIHRVGN